MFYNVKEKVVIKNLTKKKITKMIVNIMKENQFFMI